MQRHQYRPNTFTTPPQHFLNTTHVVEPVLATAAQHGKDDRRRHRQWHKILIEMRNQLFAHAGQSPFRKIEAAILVNSLTDIERVDDIAWPQFGSVAFSSSDIDQIREHILRLSTLVDEKIHLQSNKILECARRELVSK